MSVAGGVAKVIYQLCGMIQLGSSSLLAVKDVDDDVLLVELLELVVLDVVLVV